MSRVDLDLIQNFAKNWSCDSVFWGRNRILKKDPLFDLPHDGSYTKPVNAITLEECLGQATACMSEVEQPDCCKYYSEQS